MTADEIRPFLASDEALRFRSEREAAEHFGGIDGFHYSNSVAPEGWIFDMKSAYHLPKSKIEDQKALADRIFVAKMETLQRLLGEEAV